MKIAGHHRLEAYKSLGYDEIVVNTVDLDALHAELAEIDENLIRNELHYIIADNNMKRRKEIYEELYPETKSTHNGGSFKGNQHKEVSEIISPTFTKDTANKLGVSQRTVETSVQRATESDSDNRSLNTPAYTEYIFF